MNLAIQGKNIEVPQDAKDYITKKVSKFDKHMQNITKTEVEVAEQKSRSQDSHYIVEITVDCEGTLLRGEERGADIFTAVDAATDIMDRQIRRFKERIQTQREQRPSLPEVEKATLDKEREPSETSKIRVKRFPVKPMPVDEAVEQMELLGHDFFLLFNADEEQLNVLYRRKDGSYGLIKPEFD
ncbi:MAG: ribosome hibernation-promoting factor, HPF/YfiA family [Dehalococcoidia bacterium]